MPYTSASPFLLHHLLESSARRVPGKDAVVCGEDVLTYAELDRLSAALAGALHSHGVGVGDRVGIYLPKSVWSVVAIFGILRTGAAYVPLDPAAPPARIAFIVGNCAMKAIVGSGDRVVRLAGHLRSPISLAVAILRHADGVSRDALPGDVALVDWERLVAADDPRPSTAIEEDLAYVLYTSGSTGEPKGVMISHRAALAFVNWAYDTYRIGEEDRLSNHAPFHFDLSVFDVFVAIKAAATVVVLPEGRAIFPAEVATFIEEARITVWYSVPSALVGMLLHGVLRAGRFSRLRLVLFAGEVLPTRYLRRLMHLIPEASFHNLYGPTETNVCTHYEVRPLPEGKDDPIPIGRACANTETFVLTDEDEVAGTGEAGELVVRGPTLMKGYWGLAEQTAKVLVADPRSGAIRGDRVMRTGDLVRVDASGDYIFLGRRDHQVKSRGYRIELGDVETALYAHEHVQEAVVAAIPHDEIGHELVAFLVPRPRVTLSSGDLEAFCRSRLPKYMIPSAFLVVSDLPRTSTGKVDRQALVLLHLKSKAAREEVAP
jgi:amino acid adenylation domain-containing protein